MFHHITVFYLPSAKVLHSLGYYAALRPFVKTFSTRKLFYCSTHCWTITGNWQSRTNILQLLNLRRIGQAFMLNLSNDFYLTVCYSICSNVDHVDKPNHTMTSKTYTQHISFSCLQAHVSISCRLYWFLTEFTFLISSISASHHHAVLSHFQRMIPFL